MYEQYWNLNRRPFDNTAEREFFFPAECHEGALLKLRYAVENKRGAALLTGAAGTGKTMLVARLFESLESHIEPKVHVVFPLCKRDSCHSCRVFQAMTLEERHVDIVAKNFMKIFGDGLQIIGRIGQPMYQDNGIFNSVAMG